MDRHHSRHIADQRGFLFSWKETTCKTRFSVHETVNQAGNRLTIEAIRAQSANRRLCLRKQVR